MTALKQAHRCGSAGLLAVIASLVFLVTPAAAAPVLDQQQIDGSGGSLFLNTGVKLAQTFTAGQTGTLGRVDLQLERTGSVGDVLVEIRNVSAGDPGDTTLASATIPAASVGSSFEWVQVPLSASSSAGTQYAIVLSVAPGGTGGSYHWTDSSGSTFPKPQDLYPGGEAFQMWSGDTTWSVVTSPIDLTFRTYVDIAGVGAVPQTKDDCKRGGWKGFGTYKNQGQCIRAVAHLDRVGPPGAARIGRWFLS